MIENVSIDFRLANIWKSWYSFCRGKKRTIELERFSYNLEENLRCLHTDLNQGIYYHGSYRKFTVTDNKRRKIAVAPIRDRIIHRLLYEYLVPLFDRTFIYDVWSCRKNKGLIGAIERTQQLLSRNVGCFVWRSDIKKFFDSVDCEVLQQILHRKISDENTLWLLEEIISSYHNQNPVTNREREREECRGHE